MQIDFGGDAHAIPAGAVIGVMGDAGAGIPDLLAALVSAVTIIGYELDDRDAFGKAVGEMEIERKRRAGKSVVIASHDLELLGRVADEGWWVHGHRVVRKGDPREIVEAYRRHVAQRLRESLAGSPEPLEPAVRRGDGRAELLEIATLDASGEPTGGWLSGEDAVIRVRVQFHAAVAEPVVGILIRTRIGMEVYGTNTELENVKLGPCAAGDVVTIEFRFAANLCPQTYTLTAASHDPDGVWHDWIEDAVAFRITDPRYTAGVANLRARVTCSRE
jgi:lipopolysaccharide transport system ATP-binding protein